MTDLAHPPVHGTVALDPRRWRALTVSLVGAFMTLLDISIVNVALPSIEREFGVSAGAVQWVVSGYALTFGLALVPAGRLGDALGRRRMFLVALSAFVLTSAVTGAAPDSGWLIAARLLQGVAGGLLIPQNVGLIQDLFRGAERGRAFGLLGGVIGVSTAAGPLLGGLILSVASWRWVFYVNVPVGVVALLLAMRFVPATARARLRDTHLDLVGSLLLGAGVFALLLPVVTTGTGSPPALWWLAVPAVLLLGAFTWWERRTSRRGRPPVLDPALVRTDGYPAGLLISLVYFTGLTGIWLVLALFFQDGLGYSPLRSGLAVTPFALGNAVSAVLSGRLVARAGRWLTVAGLAGILIGLLLTALVLTRVGGSSAAEAAAGPLLLAGLGGGLVLSPNTTLTLQSVPPRMAGAAGGAMQTAQRIGAALGSAVLATAYYRALSDSPGDFRAAVADTLLYAAAFMVLALLIAITELLARRRRTRRAPIHGPGAASRSPRLAAAQARR